MFNRYLTFYKPAMQFVVFCAILSMCWLIGGFLVDLLHVKITGLDAKQISELKQISPSLSTPLKLLNGVLLILLLLLPAAIFSYLAYPNAFQYVGLKKPAKIKYWILSIAAIGLALPVSSLIEQACRHISFFEKYKALDAVYNRMAEAMLQGNQPIDLILNTLVICLLPAVVEEIFFRGCLQQLLLRWIRNPWLAIFIVAIIFSAFHGQVSAFLPRLFLGFILGLVYYLNGSLYTTILMHFINNFITVWLVYFFHTGVIKTNINELPDVNMILGLLCTALLIGVLFHLYKNRVEFQIYDMEKEEQIENLLQDE
ncbi:MAG: CPBP family intramembrane metalloprotease [Bacteroidetes bacterium]|nr:CPBP family intramembrane metalloprotease [Bacteroidota bacterium]